MTDSVELNKKFILWTYADYGWHPKGFETLKEALEDTRYSTDFFITSSKINYEVQELKSK